MAQLSVRQQLLIDHTMGATGTWVRVWIVLASFAWAVVAGVLARQGADGGTVYRGAGAVWVVLALVCATLAFEATSQEFSRRNEVRVRLLPTGAAQWVRDTVSVHASEVLLAWVLWMVYVLVAGCGILGPSTLVAALVLPLPALAIASVLAVGLATLFQGPYVSWNAYLLLVVTLAAGRGVSGDLIPAGAPQSLLALSPWCATERLVADCLGVRAADPHPLVLAGILLAWMVVSVGVMAGAWRWRLRRVTLAGQSVRDRRLRQYRGF